MGGTKGKDEALRLDRRSFVGMALQAVAALAALPTASALLAGCGDGEEVSKPSPATPAPSGGAVKPDPAPAAPEPKPPAPATSPGATGQQRLVTEIEAMRPTLQALQYTNASARPDQQCSNCLFYTAAEGGRGKCQLFTQGVVAERGWCSSWSAKPSA
jgi:hypothetical protein